MEKILSEKDANNHSLKIEINKFLLEKDQILTDLKKSIESKILTEQKLAAITDKYHDIEKKYKQILFEKESMITEVNQLKIKIDIIEKELI